MLHQKEKSLGPGLRLAGLLVISGIYLIGYLPLA